MAELRKSEGLSYVRPYQVQKVDTKQGKNARRKAALKLERLGSDDIPAEDNLIARLGIETLGVKELSPKPQFARLSAQRCLSDLDFAYI
ncbi:hypothetical protein E4U15_007922 [Claviceps sp. LM218 group G6]|nr:hypothetical protein E4U15_007922 [Claviceps sp. LM218 group G6]